MLHDIGRFVALGHKFSIATSDAELADYLSQILGSLSAYGPEATRYVIVVEDDGWEITWQGRPIGKPTEPARVVTTLLWHINRQAVEQTKDRPVIHAAGAEIDGVGVLLPGLAEVGKSTLVAGLVMSGFRYLSDEAISLSSGPIAMEPYPKPITLDPGSWDVLQALRPADCPYAAEQWHIDPKAIRVTALSAGCPPRFVVAPQFKAGGPTQLSPMSRSETVSLLAACSFATAFSGSRALSILADLVRGCACYRLRVSDLGAACDSIRDLASAGSL